MKPVATAATAATVATRAANECAWAAPVEQRARLAAREPQDGAHERVCNAQDAETAATGAIDLTPAGRRGLADALDQAASVQQALVLLRHAAVALYKHPEEEALRSAALRAVDTARGQLLGHGLALRQVRPAAPASRFAQQLAALDLAEFSIHLPQLHREQRMGRLKAHWWAGNMAAQDRVKAARR